MSELALKTQFFPSSLTYQVNNQERLLLDSSDRLDLQHYLLEGMTLPTNNAALKSAFFLTDEMVKDFQDLLKAFEQIQTHCNAFYNGAYTQSVGLASCIVEFNMSAKYYLGGISKISDDFSHGRVTAEYAEQAVTSLIDILLKQFSGFVRKCDTVCNGINTFLNQTYQDSVVMNGSDGKTGLNKLYTDKYGLNAQQIQQIRSDIDEAKRELDDATKEYNHDVIVAATTPTYVWVFPFGTIAAAVVAGVYGDKATKAYKKMGELREKIAQAGKNLDQKLAMVAGLAISSSQVQKLAGLIKKATQPIEAMKSTWNALSDDLQAVERTVKEDITQLPMVVKSMGVDKALAQWESVAKQADEYRRRAFITATSKNLAAANVISFPSRTGA